MSNPFLLRKLIFYTCCDLRNSAFVRAFNATMCCLQTFLPAHRIVNASSSSPNHPQLIQKGAMFARVARRGKTKAKTKKLSNDWIVKPIVSCLVLCFHICIICITDLHLKWMMATWRLERCFGHGTRAKPSDTRGKNVSSKIMQRYGNSCKIHPNSSNGMETPSKISSKTTFFLPVRRVHAFLSPSTNSFSWSIWKTKHMGTLPRSTKN